MILVLPTRHMFVDQDAEVLGFVLNTVGSATTITRQNVFSGRVELLGACPVTSTARRVRFRAAPAARPRGRPGARARPPPPPLPEPPPPEAPPCGP